MPVLFSDAPERTPGLDLPMIMPSQAQKHVTHNEAVRALDTLVHCAVIAREVTAPPPDASEGDRFLIGTGASEAWEGTVPGTLAAMEAGAWTFRTPRAGWRVYVENEDVTVLHDGVGWREDGGRPEEPAEPETVERLERLGIGTDADSNNRLSVAAAVTLFNHDAEGSHRLTMNRESGADTASVVFQTAWSGRAEMGLAGANDWSVKVSADGADWREAMRADAATGAVSFPHGTSPDQMIGAPEYRGTGGTQTIGPPNLQTVPVYTTTLKLTQNRLYLVPTLVDRPTLLLGLDAAQSVASSTGGAVLRAGLYRLGAADGTSWRIGDLIADLGTEPADAAGAKLFAAPEPVLLQPGWYAVAIGTNGVNATLRHPRWLTPGLGHYGPYGSGASAELRTNGPAAYGYVGDKGAAIRDGLGTVGVVSAARLNRHYTYQLAVPRWRLW